MSWKTLVNARYKLNTISPQAVLLRYILNIMNDQYILFGVKQVHFVVVNNSSFPVIDAFKIIIKI